MNMMRKALLRIALLILPLSFCIHPLLSQDIHFSQYVASPLTLNPASGGDYEGAWRAMAIYRSQWAAISTPFESIAIGYEKKFEKFNGGLVFLNDRTGDVRLNSNKLYANLGLVRSLAGLELRLGGQLGLAHKYVDVNSLSYPNQFNYGSGQFDPSLPNGENNIKNSILYPDLNLGIFLRRNSEKLSPFLGLSVFHVTHPNESFSGYTERLPMRTNVNLGINWRLSPQIAFVPEVLYSHHTKAHELLAGAHAYYYLLPNALQAKSLFVGGEVRTGLGRNTDALIVIAGMEIKKIRAGISYDSNVSQLSDATNSQGAFELSLIYTGIISVPEQIQIPCDRY